MSGLELPVPTPAEGADEAGDSLEMLREELKAQREKQKATLAKHKRTTFLAVETAKKGTTFYDAAKLREMLEADEEQVAGD